MWCLGLAGAGGGTVRLATVGLGTSGLAICLSADSLGDVQRVGKRSLAHAAQRRTGSLGGVLLVSREIEGDEQDQVGAENCDSSKSGELLTSALASIGHPGEVGGREVSVRGEVNKAY